MKKNIEFSSMLIKNNKNRAIAAIFLASFSILSLALAILSNFFGFNNKIVPFYFYPGLALVVIMTIKWTPSIIFSLKSSDFLVKNENEGIVISGMGENYSNSRFLKKSEVKEVCIDKTFFKKEMIFVMKDDSIIKIPIIFSEM